MSKFSKRGTCCVTGVTWLFLMAGCFQDAGVGGTGEIVVPAQKLHEVGKLDPVPATTEPSTRPTTAPAQVELTIEQCRQYALHNNLDLRVELLNPTLAKESLSEAEARYEALFTTDANFAKTDSATASQLTNQQAESINVSPGVQIPLRTGGTVSVNVPINRIETNNAFSTLNPAYTTDLQASISLPLLRGAGLFYNTQQIRIAFYQYQATQGS